MSADLAATAGRDLLRVALLAKLAVDLQDPMLARRAAREAQTQARLLAGLDFPAHRDVEDDEDDLPELEEVLTRAYPPAEQDPDPAGEM